MRIEEEEAKRLASFGRIRPKFLYYSPEDIFEIDCIDSLNDLFQCYTPCGQPQNIYEFAYCELMTHSIVRRLAALSLTHV